MPYIRVKTGPHKGKIFEIMDEVITLGRDENQTIQILDQGVSRKHSEIFRIGELCFVRDLVSTNGTFVNSQRVDEEVLKVRDELLIGTTILVFEDKEAEASLREASDLFTDGEEDGADIESRTLELDLGVSGGKVKEGVLQRSKYLQFSGDLSRILQGEEGLDKLLDDAVDFVGTGIRAGEGTLFLRNPATDKMEAKVLFEKGSPGERIVSRTIFKRVLSSGVPLLTSDATVDDRFALSESIVLNKIKSVICAPILYREKVEGVLYFHSSETEEAFDQADLEITAEGALQLSLFMAGHRVVEKNRAGFVRTVKALVTAMEIFDTRNKGHSERVAEYCSAMGRQLKLAPEELYHLHLAALLHDVGKLAVHHSLIGVKKDQIRDQHVYAGEKIIGQIEGMEAVVPIVRHHHERADGSGFPYKVTNEKIPLLARILIVANAFDDECHRGGVGGEALQVKDVLKDMAARGGKEFDDDVIKSLLVCHRNGTLYLGEQAR